MKVIPSIDLKDGKSVKLVRGVLGTAIEVSNEPVELAAYWEREGAEILHVVDLDGAIEQKGTNKEIIRKIVREVSIPVEVGGGIRSKEDVLYVHPKNIFKGAFLPSSHHRKRSNYIPF